MLCDNILPNLNITRLVIDKLYTDVKTTYDTKMIHIMVSFSDYQNPILLIEFPKNTKIGSFMVFYKFLFR